VLKPKSSQSSGCIHIDKKKKAENFKQTLSACRKTDGNYFQGQENGDDGGIPKQGTPITSEMYCVQSRRNMYSAGHSESKASGAVHRRDNALTSTAARTRALLEQFNWELCDNTPYSPDLTRSDYNLFTCLKN
jgi:hypothetical protein